MKSCKREEVKLIIYLCEEGKVVHSAVAGVGLKSLVFFFLYLQKSNGGLLKCCEILNKQVAYGERIAACSTGPSVAEQSVVGRCLPSVGPSRCLCLGKTLLCYYGMQQNF